MPSLWNDWMALALQEAEKAFEEEEVPVGAVLVSSAGEVLAQDHNRPRQLSDPTAHAEVLALRRAAAKVGNFRLPGTTLLVTLEPCLMCAGALLQARVDRVVYGAADPKAGALGSIYDLSEDPRLNHRFQVIRGVQEEACRGLMQRFFQQRR